MTNPFDIVQPTQLAWIAISVFLLGMAKGGFPVGNVVLPLLILAWPGARDSARAAVAFMLPLLCAMDVVAVLFYRKHILWQRIVPLLPGMLTGVLVASLLFVSDKSVVSVSDRALKFSIGVIVMSFVLFRTVEARLQRRLSQIENPGTFLASAFGIIAGITSTVAHAAGPVMSMYYLPQRLPKMNFAGTLAGFFFIMNLVKVAPFAYFGRFDSVGITMGLWLLPLIPVGVGIGFWAVRAMKPALYEGLIYLLLLLVAVLLIAQSLGMSSAN